MYLNNKFLGVIIDENIKWTEHILKIKQKISRGFGVISKARKFLNSSTLVTLYYSFVYPHITYCIQVWGSANDYLIKSIFKLQEKNCKNDKAIFL